MSYAVISKHWWASTLLLTLSTPHFSPFLSCSSLLVLREIFHVIFALLATFLFILCSFLLLIPHLSDYSLNLSQGLLLCLSFSFLSLLFFFLSSTARCKCCIVGELCGGGCWGYWAVCCWWWSSFSSWPPGNAKKCSARSAWGLQDPWSQTADRGMKGWGEVRMSFFDAES